MIKLGLNKKWYIPVDDIATLVCGIYAGYQSAQGKDPNPYLLYGPTSIRGLLVPPFMLFTKRSLGLAHRVVQKKSSELPASACAQMTKGFKEGKDEITLKKTAYATAKEICISALETAVGYSIGYTIGRIS